MVEGKWSRQATDRWSGVLGPGPALANAACRRQRTSARGGWRGLLVAGAVVAWGPAAAVAETAAASGAGALVLIGGGDKPPEVLQRFVDLAGGAEAPIVVVPAASGEPDTPEYYETLFRGETTARNVRGLALWTRADAGRPELVEALRGARGIFFSGGDQNRITAALLGTPALEAIRAAHAAGAAIGGTSAGTACMSARMITGDGNFEVIATGAVATAPGLGLFPHAVVDQHFVARQRTNRLLSVVLEGPEHLGVGIDEATAVELAADGTFTVLGRGSVVVIDGGVAAPTVRRGGPAAPLRPAAPAEDGEDAPPLPPTGEVHNLGAREVKVHVLLPGDRYDLAARRVL
jgi:cyanophycinase